MLFSFVILHYKTYEDTINCVESIKQLECRKKIIIIDNFSNDGSSEILCEHFKDDDIVIILSTKKNIGFAGGNNYGYEFAKTNLKSDFIIMLNNDIIVSADNRIERVVQDYQEGAAIIGPDIMTLDNKHQNPVPKNQLTSKEAKKGILKYVLLYVLNKVRLYTLLRNVFRKGFSQNKKEKQLSVDFSDVKLHGSFLIYTPNYVQKENFAFVPGTFFYLEEDLLYEYCKQKKYKLLFDSELKVLHKEDSSTNAKFEDSYAKRNFVFKNKVNSFLVYLEFLKKKV